MGEPHHEMIFMKAQEFCLLLLSRSCIQVDVRYPINTLHYLFNVLEVTKFFSFSLCL